MRASRFELERHDWAALRCGCRESGAHLPETFSRLLEARTIEETVGHRLDGHLEEQSMLFQVAPHAVPVILAALQEEDLPAFVRSHFLTVLWRLVTGESHRSEAEAGSPDLEEECCAGAREGIWLLYHEAVSGDVETALDILEFVDPDEARFEAFRSALQDRLKKKRS
ncbi:hypothetical protein ACFWU3_09240 [Streptomyces sp. NPDC058685]|uniref:hypothetical protein n=1 Tax=Streptomyces sp. NPDC058685 TaxID=3346598 RepID=UPI003648A98B